MRPAALLAVLLASLLAGCAATLPDTPRITAISTNAAPIPAERGSAAPLSIAIHIRPEALGSHAVGYDYQNRALDYGELAPHVVAAVKNNAPKAFERVFLTPMVPNALLWKEGIDAVMVIESARANKIRVSDPKKDYPDTGWEVVVVAGVYTIDGRPLGYHGASAAGKAYYRSDVLSSLAAYPDRRRAEEIESRSLGCQGLDCTVAETQLAVLSLESAVDAAVARAFRLFPAAEVSSYLSTRAAEIDAEYGSYLGRKDDAEYLRALNEAGKKDVASLTPSLAAPTMDPVASRVKDMREAAQRAQTAAALSAAASTLQSLQARNFANMGMHQQAATASMVSNINRQMIPIHQAQADQYISQLNRAGYDANVNDYSVLLTLLGGVASYTDYRLQKQAQAGLPGGADSRCPDLLRMRDRALQNKKDLRSATAQAGVQKSGRPQGQAGAQHDAAEAFQRIYNAYCT